MAVFDVGSLRADETQFELAAANTKFAWTLYRYLANSATGNMFMSPLSISVALAMTHLGARNNTKKQINEVLHFGGIDEAKLHQAFSVIRQALTGSKKTHKLLLANRLFGDKNYRFLQDFLDAGDKYYGARLEPVDFTGDGAADTINNWVAENTAHKITKLIPPGNFSGTNTRLVLVNAVYFNGEWKEKFDAADTTEEDFHVSPTEEVRVQLMHLRETEFKVGINSQLSCKAIELPYVGDQLTMVVILPDESSSLQKLEAALTADDILHLHDKFEMSEREVNVWLPRFRLDEKIDLTKTLAALGLTDMFIPDVADFSGMNGNRTLFVWQALHQAVVDVNEEGTEAAAATAMAMCDGVMLTKPVEFRADRPFIFFIRHVTTNSVLFLGRVVRPEIATV